MKTSEKAVNAMFGAPVVAYKRLGEARSKLVDMATTEFEAWSKEGTKVRKKINKNPIVSEINTRVDLDNVGDRVGKLRHQMEEMLTNWREGFRPEEKKSGGRKPAGKAPAKKAAAKRPTAKKSTAKKPAATKSTPAEKIEVEEETSE